MSAFPIAHHIIEWLNGNQGLVSVLIFASTLAFGWLTGIFAALKRRPQFRIRIIQGPTFCSTFPTGARRDNFDIHRSAFALYLHVSNIGSASGSIHAIHLGYHWSIRPFSFKWMRYAIGWFWIKNQTAAINDFQARIGENVKIFPFLFQESIISGKSSKTFLQIGESTNGVVYFEQPDSWGCCLPFIEHNCVKVRVKIIDAFGRSHAQTFRIPNVTTEEAKVYNPSFGSTLAHLRGEIGEPNLDGLFSDGAQ